MEMNLLDKEKLSYALKGQLRTENVKTAWVQEVPKTVADLVKYLKIEGPSLEPFTIPFKKQVYSVLKSFYMIHQYLVFNI
jgi:hypothetical protein